MNNTHAPENEAPDSITVKVDYVDITPTWEQASFMLAVALESGTHEGRQLARAEVRRMGKLLDLWKAEIANPLWAVFGPGERGEVFLGAVRAEARKQACLAVARDLEEQDEHDWNDRTIGMRAERVTDDEVKLLQAWSDEGSRPNEFPL